MTNLGNRLRQAAKRARDLGLILQGRCGENNAITDVPGVEVGYSTLIRGSGPLVVGEGPVRTGVTAILPRGAQDPLTPVWAGVDSFNGNGELTGSRWIDEAGYFLGPVCITNTHCVGITHQAVLRWITRHRDYDLDRFRWILPVVGETYDGYLNDINGFHVTEGDVISAIENASGGAIEEGNVGGGTGMICFEFKGGTGTASRRIKVHGNDVIVGALVQANFGIRRWCNLLGVPLGKYLSENTLTNAGRGSIMGVVATNAPLLPIQLQRVARRLVIGVGRTGTPAATSSGDIFLAFSTANASRSFMDDAALSRFAFLPDGALDPIFEATVEAVEEAIINAMVAGETMVGRDNNRVVRIDHDKLCAVMRRYNRLAS